jgi:cysteinyl-tRNA synthetase
MISATLGYEIDVHCGGIDNVYRHHDYNRAVMEGVSGEEFCHYWIHGEHLLLNGRKMSKSTGNVSYPSDLEDKGYSPSQIRFSLIYGYYRDRLNLDDGRLADTSEYLQAIRSRAERLSNAAEPSEDPSGRPEAESRRTDRIIDEIPRLFRRSMDADLHTAGAVDDVYAVLGHLEQRGRLYGRTVEQARRIRDHLSDIDSVLGVMFD